MDVSLRLRVNAMTDWTPQRSSLDPRASCAELSREESFVLASVDGASSVADLADITGLDARDVERILNRLVTQGAVTPSPWALEATTDDDAPASDDFAAPAAVEEEPAVGAVEALEQSEEGAEQEAPFDETSEGSELPNVESAGELTHRALYESELHRLPVAARIAKARVCDEPTLTALCFDADAQVISALLDNERLNTTHARIVAGAHGNPVGLEAIVARAVFLRDTQVQRRLLRNAHLTDALLRRVLNPRRLLEIYKTALDRDVSDRTRTGAKGLLKSKYAQAAPEERFELLWTTEGRVLPLLLGQNVDQKTAALLCGRNAYPMTLIQNLARFPATPPSVLNHLLKQPLVKRQPQLRAMLLQHSNVPSEAKRRT
jgi:hypothetical protein